MGHLPTLTPAAQPAYTYLNDFPKEATEEQIRVGARVVVGCSASGHCSSRWTMNQALWEYVHLVRTKDDELR